MKCPKCKQKPESYHAITGLCRHCFSIYEPIRDEIFKQFCAGWFDANLDAEPDKTEPF